MKLKLGCAAVVVGSLCCCLTVHGGALKNLFFGNRDRVEAPSDTGIRPEIGGGSSSSSAGSSSNGASSSSDTGSESSSDSSDSGADNDAGSSSDEQSSQDKSEESSSESSESDSTDSSAASTANASSADEKVTPPSEKKKVVGNPVIFRIGRAEIHYNDIIEDMKHVPPQQAQQIPPEKLIEILKQQKLISYLMVEQAKRAGLDKTKEFLDQVEKLKERLLFETYLIKEIGPKTEDEVTLKAKYQRYLAEFKPGKEAKLRLIAVDTEKIAKEVIDALSKGTSFERLQKEKSPATAQANDNYVPVAMLPKEISDVLNKLKKNEHNKEPIKAGDKYLIFEIVDWRDSKPGSYESVKPMLAQVVMKEEMDKLIERLKKQFDVKEYNEYDGSLVVPRTPISGN